MMKKLIKKSKGVSLISLVITVAVILILTNVVVYNATDSLRATKLSNMQADIENLRDKVSTYYAQYGMIPADTSIAYTNTSHINSISEATDTGHFYVIDLAAMENVTLNYGKDYEKIRSGQATTQDQINQLTDLYIINGTSHNIFYVDGIEAGDETFYTDYSAEDKDKVAVTLYKNSEETEEPTTPEEPDNSVVAADIPATDYGAIVKGYDCTNSAAVNNWLLFYADDNNIYLIVDDYIHYDYCPSSATQKIIRENRNNNYELSMDNVLKDYRGSSDITDQRIQALNSELFSAYPNVNTEAMKKVAYMLDIDVWNVYAGEYADYAIGGPTVELFINSYNKKYGTSYKATVKSQFGAIGYGFSNPQGLTLSVADDPTYIIPSTSKVEFGMWMASPHANYQTSLMAAEYIVSYGRGTAELSQDGYDDNNYSHYGFRPIVCLKHDVKLQKNSDGSYTIIGS